MGCHPARRGRRGRWPAGALPGCLIVGVVALVTTASGLHPATAIQYLGSTGGMRLNSPIVGMATTRSGAGYWLVAGDGGIFSFGDASFRGSTGAIHLNKPIVGMAATPTGGGYWLVATDGGIFSFGDAAFHGSTGAIGLNSPIVGMAATPTGGGYWLVAADGGIFSFGDAAFHGSTGADHLSSPIVGMAGTPTGAGYWLVGADGAVFGYGDAVNHGGAPAFSQQPVVSIVATPDGGGYWITTATGDVFTFGNAVLYGSTGGVPLTQPIVGMAGPRQGGGYWLVARDGGIFSFPGVPPPPPSASYAWMATNNDGSPVRYNPCQVVHYVVNLSEAPARALTDVESSLGRISAATGIPFAYDGTTSELPSTNRAAYQPQTYGTRWAPILLAWERPGQGDFLTSGSVGDGGSTYLATTTLGQSAYVTGQAALDSTRALPDGFEDPVAWGPVLMHEVGHIMGIAHVGDQGQVMYPTIHPGGPRSYGEGDRAGLRAAGAASGCLSTPQPSATTTSSVRSTGRDGGASTKHSP